MTPAPAVVLTEWRCAKCKRLLMKKHLGPGTYIETKCKHCNTFNTITVPEVK